MTRRAIRYYLAYFLPAFRLAICHSLLATAVDIAHFSSAAAFSPTSCHARWPFHISLGSRDFAFRLPTAADFAQILKRRTTPPLATCYQCRLSHFGLAYPLSPRTELSR